MGRTIHLLTRITLLLCTMCISLQLLAQTRTVSVKADGQKVADVLKIIEQQSGFTFFYNDAAFDKNRRISIDAQNKDVLAVLEEVFRGTDVRASIIEGNIVLSNKPQAGQDQQGQTNPLVQGTVLDSEGQPLPGASVFVKGTKTGTVTNNAGAFSIPAKEGDVLTVSFLGFRDLEINVGKKALYTVALETDAEFLDDVVVVGYGTQKKVNLTGAVGAISSEVLDNKPITQTSTALQGSIPGVTVTDGYDCVKTDANGVYQFKSNSLTRFVYYTTPAEYKISTPTSPSQPVFYKAVSPDGKVLRTDFVLEPLPGGKETKWTFVGIGDPQCCKTAEANRYSSETIPDLKKATAGLSSVYAMTLGDIVFDSTNMWPTMKAAMSTVYNGTSHVVFFQTIGNHDHDSLKPDTARDLTDDYNATSTFGSYFGPTDYSFDRGDVHVVSMDDIPVTSLHSSSKSNGKTWDYGKGFTDAQYQWLKKDLDLVADKENKMVFICCHIPFRGATTNHMLDVVKLMMNFKEAHIMIGHTHYTQNYVYGSSYKAKGGLPVYEHIHGSACGAWWTSTSSSTVTGEPSGYTIYDIEGAHIKDWKFKGTNKDADFQLRVFDGNAVYYQAMSYPLNWYTASQKAGTGAVTVKGNSNLKNCFAAQVFNDDDTYWTVELRMKSTGV